jgi:hypothetical protein
VGKLVGRHFGLGTFGGALGLYLVTGSFNVANSTIFLVSIVGLILGFFLKPRP